jgi:hypothetical protein
VVACVRHDLVIIILAAALRHQSSKFILRTSTIICMMTIMVEVLNILQFLQRDSIKVEPELGIFRIEIFSLYRSIFRKKMIFKKADVEDALKGLDRLIQEVAQIAGAQLLKDTNMIDHGVRGKLRITCLSWTIGWSMSMISLCRRSREGRRQQSEGCRLRPSIMVTSFIHRRRIV